MTLNLKNCSVKDLFYEIQRQTDLFFVYNLRNFENVGTINVKAKNEEVDKVLARVFEGRDVEFLFEDNTVVVRPMGSCPSHAIATATSAGTEGNRRRKGRTGQCAAGGGYCD